MDDPFGTAALRAAVLDAWAGSPTRFREDANAEEDLRLGGYADAWFVELAQNAADAAGSGGRLRVAVEAGELRVANTGAPLTRDGVAALASLRASAKRDDGGAVGRFGVGFAAVLPLTDAPRVVSTSGGVAFSAAWTADAVAPLPGPAAELARRDGPPVLRLAWPVVEELPAGYTSEVRLPLRPGLDAGVLLEHARTSAPDLLLALPALDAIEVAGEVFTREIGRRWRTVSRTGELASADVAAEQRDRRTFTVTWALPLDAPLGDDVAHAPTATAEALSLPARLIATFPLEPDRRRVRPGAATDAIVAAAAGAYVDLVLATPPADRLALVPLPGFPRSTLDAALREALLSALRTARWLQTPPEVQEGHPHAPGGHEGGLPEPGEGLAPGRAEWIDIPGVGDRLPALLAAASFDRLAGPPYLPAALDALGATRVSAAALVERLFGIDRPPTWWAAVYDELGDLADTVPGLLDDLRALPVPLADGRSAAGPATVLLPVPDLGREPDLDLVREPGPDLGREPDLDLVREPGPDLGREPDLDLVREPGPDLGREPDLGRDPVPDPGREPVPDLGPVPDPGREPVPDLGEWGAGLGRPLPDLPGLPVAALHHPLLARLGAAPAEPATLLAHPALRDAVDRSLDDADAGLDVTPLAEAVLALIGRAPTAVPALALPAADGGWARADELVLPDGALRPLLAPDAPLDVLDPGFAGRFPRDVLVAAGVLDGFALVDDDAPTGPDHDLDDEERWWDTLDEPPARLVAVRDLDLVADDAWPAALALLAAQRETREAGYTTWWLARHARLGGHRLAHWRLADATTLAALYDPVPATAVDDAFLTSIGVREDLRIPDARAADDLLARLADPTRHPSAALVAEAHVALADAVADGRVDAADLELPEHVRALDGSVAHVDVAAVLDEPWPAAVLPPGELVIGGDPLALAQLLDLPLASEIVAGTIEGGGTPVAWAELGEVVVACHTLGVAIPDGELLLHDELWVRLTRPQQGRHRVPVWRDPAGTWHAADPLRALLAVLACYTEP